MGRAEAAFWQSHGHVPNDHENVKIALNEPLRDLPRLASAVPRILYPLEAHEVDTIALARAKSDLANIEEERGEASSAASLRYAQEQAAHWHKRAAGIAEEVAEFERFLQEEHPVQLNGDSVSRVPRAWIGRRPPETQRAIAFSRADGAAGRIGLDECREELTWVAWRELSGGLSEGYIWLAFDEDGVICDVSSPPKAFGCAIADDHACRECFAKMYIAIRTNGTTSDPSTATLGTQPARHRGSSQRTMPFKISNTSVAPCAYAQAKIETS